MLHNHPFSQRNKATKRAVGVEVGGNGGEVGQNLKKGGGVANKGGVGGG